MLKKDRKAYVEIGYIFTYLISAMLLVSILASTLNLGRETRESSLELLLQDIANSLAAKLETAAQLARACNNSTFNLSFSFYSELAGSPTQVMYKIEVTNNTVFINTTDIKVKDSIYNPGNVWIKTEGDYIVGWIIFRESASGTSDRIRISYDGAQIVISK